jgi:hypothetical protein
MYDSGARLLRYKAATLPTPSAGTGAMEAGVSGAGLGQRGRFGSRCDQLHLPRFPAQFGWWALVYKVRLLKTRYWSRATPNTAHDRHFVYWSMAEARLRFVPEPWQCAQRPSPVNTPLPARMMSTSGKSPRERAKR